MRLQLFLHVQMQVSVYLCHPGEDDLDILTALLAENEGIGEQQAGREQADDLDGLFDDDNDEGEEYKEGAEEEQRDAVEEDAVANLFGDVGDIENEDKGAKENESAGEASENLNRSKEDLQGLCCNNLTFNLLLPDGKKFSLVTC